MAQHHFLPQFYLKGFMDPAPPKNHVWVHRPETGWERRAIKDTAAEAGYYNLKDSTGNATDEFERMLGRVENVAATLIRKKIASRATLTDEERFHFSIFIAAMEARVPGQRDHVGDFVARVGEMVLAAGVQGMMEDPRRWEAFKQYYEAKTGERIPDEIGPKDMHPKHYKLETNPQVSLALSFSTLELFSRMIFDKGWRFLITREPVFFITSDYPIGIYDPETEGTFYGPVLAAPATEVSFPLNKTIALLAGGKMAGTAWLSATEKLVSQINARSMMRASFLISATQSAFGLKL